MAELSGLEVLALTKEIDSALRGSYVNNIYSLGTSQLVRFRGPGGGDAWLVASPAQGVWLSDKVAERGETSEFTTKLRGELERCRFVAASQVGLDRIFRLDFESHDERRVLVELMPPGNIIVTDDQGKILLTKEEVRSPARRVVRGGIYDPPGQRRRDPRSVEAVDVTDMAGKETTAGKALGRHVSLPRKYVVELLSRLSLKEDSPSAELGAKAPEAASALKAMIAEARDSPRPCICTTPWGEELLVVRSQAFEVEQETTSVSSACDQLLLAEASAMKSEETVQERKKKELEVTIGRLKENEAVLMKEAGRFRDAARKVTTSGTVEDGMKLLAEAGAKARKVPASASAVASALFDRAKELEGKASEARESAAKLSKKVPVVKVGAGPGRSIARKKQEWYEKFRWFFTSEGKLAVGGRDAGSNSALVRRQADDSDVIYHADLFGSPFFVLKGGKSQTDEEVREVAQATVAFSSAWKTGLGAADAYWVAPDQVGTAAPSGEYLPRGSFAIKGKKNFVNKNLVEVAVGVDASEKLMAGPESAVKKRVSRYVVLKPHREKASETAKKVRAELGAGSVTLDEVLRALPSGGGKLVRKVGFD